MKTILRYGFLPGHANSGRQRFLFLLPWLMLFVGLSITYVLWQHAVRNATLTVETEFNFWVNKIVYNIEYRLTAHMQILRGVAGLFDASDMVSRSEFKAYVDALQLEHGFPGIQGVGFVQVVPAAEKIAHEAAQRAQGLADYQLWPAGDREFYTAIVYLEPPPSRNAYGFGYDMFSEAVRRQAMIRARDQGTVALSGKITLVQEPNMDAQSGFALYVPVYRPQTPHTTLEERRANLLGWAYSPMWLHDMMTSLLWTVEFDGLHWPLDVEIYDGGADHAGEPETPFVFTPERLLYDLDRIPRNTQTSSAFYSTRSIHFGGHRWLLLASSKPEMRAQLIAQKTHIIVFVGAGGSLLLSILLGLLARSHIRLTGALKEAMAAGRKVRASEEQLRAFFDNAGSLVWVKDVEGRFLIVNRYLENVLERSRTQLIGHTVAELFKPTEAAMYAANDQQVIVAGNSLIFEETVQLEDGVHTFLSVKFPLRDPQGTIYALGAICTDISRQKRTEDALRTSLEEKTVLLKEVHHRVKNNLQIISSLLNLQAARIQIPAARNVLQDTQNRIRSMALLHESLYRSGTLARITMPDYVNNLCTQLWRFGGTPVARIRVEREIADFTLPLDQAVPCGLIINELLSNALKHAHPPGEAGQIKLQLYIEAGEHIVVRVADDGVGLPAILDVTRAETLGLNLIRMLTEQLQGRLEVWRECGTVFQISFPMAEP